MKEKHYNKEEKKMSAKEVHAVGIEDVGYNGSSNNVQLFSTEGGEEWRKKKAAGNHASFAELLGLDELFSLEVWRASVGEVLGTACLVFMLDTIVISSIETNTKTPNLIMSCIAAVVITILLLATHPISGGHINPIVTLAATFTGLISLSRAFVYILAQCVGAVLGALALKLVVSSAIERTYSLGACTLNIVTSGPDGPVTIGLETGQALWLEIFCSFVFLYASIWMAFDHRQAQALGKLVVFSIVGIVLGLLVFISTTVTSAKGYAGAGMNPARCIGPAIVRGGHLWTGHWVFWVGPGIAVAAFYLYVKIIPGHHFTHADGYKHDLLTVVRSSFKKGSSRK